MKLLGNDVITPEELHQAVNNAVAPLKKDIRNLGICLSVVSVSLIGVILSLIL